MLRGIFLNTYLYTCIAVLLFVGVIASTSNNSEDLYRLISSSHNKDIRPCLSCGSPLRINLTFCLASLNDLDEVAGEANTVAWLSATWVDERIQWDPQEYGGLKSLKMPFEKVWTPILVVGNPARKVSSLNGEISLVRVMSTGQMVWTPGDVFYTKCYPDIYRYPMDTQRCFISFLPWGFPHSELLVHGVKAVTGSGYEDSGEWVLENLESEDIIMSHHSVVRFYFTVRRRSEFFIINIILPIILLSFLNSLVFMLPVRSGERVSFSVTILLSFAVFSTLVSDTIPKTSNPTPLLCYFLMAVITGSSLIVIITIHTISVYHREADVPINGVYKLFVTLKPKPFKSKTNPDLVIDPPFNDIGDSPDKGATWKDVAARLDRLCLLVFFVYFIVCYLLCLLVLPIASAE